MIERMRIRRSHYLGNHFGLTLDFYGDNPFENEEDEELREKYQFSLLQFSYDKTSKSGHIQLDGKKKSVDKFLEDFGLVDGQSSEEKSLMKNMENLEKIFKAIRKRMVSKEEFNQFKTVTEDLQGQLGVVESLCKQRESFIEKATVAFNKLEALAKQKFPKDKPLGHLMVMELDPDTPGGLRILIGGGKPKDEEKACEPGVYEYTDNSLYGYADSPGDWKIDSIQQLNFRNSLDNNELQQFIDAVERITNT